MQGICDSLRAILHDGSSERLPQLECVSPVSWFGGALGLVELIDWIYDLFVLEVEWAQVDLELVFRLVFQRRIRASLLIFILFDFLGTVFSPVELLQPRMVDHLISIHSLGGIFLQEPTYEAHTLEADIFPDSVLVEAPAAIFNLRHKCLLVIREER